MIANKNATNEKSRKATQLIPAATFLLFDFRLAPERFKAKYNSSI